jgi:hypothetical protein
MGTKDLQAGRGSHGRRSHIGFGLIFGVLLEVGRELGWASISWRAALGLSIWIAAISGAGASYKIHRRRARR